MRTVQPTVLEVPVTVQGSKSVEGTGQRELFTETTKTVLVFENGAVMNLQSRLSPGQTVFLRNDQSGREILCRVLESPAVGKVGPTDLEFTVYDPEFWVVKADAPPAAAPKPEAAAPETSTPETATPETAAAEIASPETAMQEPPNPEAPKPTELPVAIPVAARTVEEIVPAYEPVVSASPEVAPASSDVPTPALEAAVANPAAVDQALPEQANASEPADTATVRKHVAEAELSDAEAEERLAALMALEANKTAMRAAAKKAKETGQAAAPGDPQSPSEKESGDPSHAAEIPIAPAATHAIFNSALAQNPIVMGIAASILIIVVVGIAWHARRGSLNRAATGDRAAAASLKSSQNAVGAAAQSPPPPGASNAATIPGPSAPKIQQPGVTPKADLRATHGGAPGDNYGGPIVSDSTANPTTRISDGAVLSRSNATRPNARGIVPAKIVTQPQPAFPAWAKSLDLDGVVTLDALIDENGNLAKTKVLSGPRALQRAAQDAVALWIFEPAQNSGKPVASHLLLTVEFQR